MREDRHQKFEKKSLGPKSPDMRVSSHDEWSDLNGWKGDQQGHVSQSIRWQLKPKDKQRPPDATSSRTSGKDEEIGNTRISPPPKSPPKIKFLNRSPQCTGYSQKIKPEAIAVQRFLLEPSSLQPETHSKGHGLYLLTITLYYRASDLKTKSHNHFSRKTSLRNLRFLSPNPRLQLA